MKMDKQQKTIITVVGILLLLCITATALVYVHKKAQSSFTPPPFDAGAVTGTPEIQDDSAQYRTVKIGDEILFSMCLCPKYEDGEAKLFFASDKENFAFLRVLLFDTDGNLVGESGLIKPGDYVEGLALSFTPTSDTTINAKILSYDLKEYTSMGTSGGELLLRSGPSVK